MGAFDRLNAVLQYAVLSLALPTSCKEDVCAEIASGPGLNDTDGPHHWKSNYFQVSVNNLAGVTITHVSGNFLAPGDCQFWTRPGIPGFANVGSHWVLAGEWPVEAPGILRLRLSPPLMLDVGPHSVLFSHTGQVRYTMGLAVGSVVSSDSWLSIHEGHATGELEPTILPSRLHSPRVWSGSFGYVPGMFELRSKGRCQLFPMSGDRCRAAALALGLDTDALPVETAFAGACRFKDGVLNGHSLEAPCSNENGCVCATYPKSVVLHGACPESTVNGIYRYEGSSNGSPRYARSVGSQLWQLHHDSQSWRVDDGVPSRPNVTARVPSTELAGPSNDASWDVHCSPSWRRFPLTASLPSMDLPTYDGMATVPFQKAHRSERALFIGILCGITVIASLAIALLCVCLRLRRLRQQMQYKPSKECGDAIPLGRVDPSNVEVAV